MDLDGPATPMVSYDKRWELHKPLLARLYLEEHLTLSKIRDIMRGEHNFPAE